jgi:hypothetical protein
MNKKYFYYLFLFIPFCSSTVSAIHIEKFLRLGNPIWLSIPVASVYEAANIIIVMLLSDKILKNRTFAFITFIILIFMQVVGNVYFSYEYYSKYIVGDYFKEIYSIIFDETDEKFIKVILSLLIGAVIPIVSLLLTKIISDMKNENEEKLDQDPVKKEIETEDLVKKTEEKELVEEANKEEIKNNLSNYQDKDIYSNISNIKTDDIR